MNNEASSGYSHIPVLKPEITKLFQDYTKKYILDCTLGEGGHSEFFLESFYPDIFLVGIERDPNLYSIALKRLDRFKEKTELFNGSFSRLDEYLSRLPFKFLATGILFDIGISSFHVDLSGRGFSFLKDEPLDMRFDPGDGISAADVINSFSQEDLADIFYEYGEERLSRRIASVIIKRRKDSPIQTSSELADLVFGCYPRRKHYRIHPATRVFQALRIYVNHELDEFRIALEKSINYLAPGGKLIVISYHSLEDRIVKRYFKSLSKEEFQIHTKKPLSPSLEEINDNRRARSAKMRVLIKR